MGTQIIPPVNPLERSAIYSDELLRAICNTIRSGATLNAAVKMHGISHETLYSWMRNSPAVSDMVARARAEVRAKVEIKFTSDALEGDDWRARHAYLQSNPDTRADWGPVLNLATVPVEKLRELVGGSDTPDAWPSLQEEQRQLTTVDNEPEQQQDSAAE